MFVKLLKVVPSERGREPEMLMDGLVPLTEAKTRLFELVREADEHDVVILRHGRPVAVLVSVKRMDALLEEIEDLRDQLALCESERSPADLRIPLEKATTELGVDLKR